MRIPAEGRVGWESNHSARLRRECAVNEEASRLLERAALLWSRAQVMYEGATWRGEPEPLAVAEEIARNHLECRDGLIELLSSKNQLVVAYALQTLEMMGSEVLAELPAELLWSAPQKLVQLE
jgi:hypothetical protein